MHLLNSKDRVTIKTFIPKVNTNTLQETGVKTSSYEGIIRDLKLVPDDIASLT